MAITDLEQLNLGQYKRTSYISTAHTACVTLQKYYFSMGYLLLCFAWLHIKQ